MNIDETYGVQVNAWMDEDALIGWCENVFKFVVNGRTLLILDSLRVHKTNRVVEYFKKYCADLIFVPPGCTEVCRLLKLF